MFRKSLTLLAALASLGTAPQLASAQSTDSYLGAIWLFGGNFCPRGTAEANGQLISIAQNTALFSLFGTTYGGDGRTTFALPDMRGRVPVGIGQGPGLSTVRQGQKAGSENATLTIANMPPHNHGVSATAQASSLPGSTSSPLGQLNAEDTSGTNYGTGAPAAMASDAIAVTQNTVGGGQPVSIRNPYIGMRWCVNMFGVFPSRN